jgi:hypothetical protein
MSDVLEWDGRRRRDNDARASVLPQFRLIALVFLLLVAATVLLALAAAIVASPYLLVRSVRGHWRKRTAARYLHAPHRPLTPSTERKRGDHSEYLNQPPGPPRRPA